VQLKCIERRINDEVGSILTPIKYAPKYEELKPFFQNLLNKERSTGQYEKRFKIGVSKLTEKDLRTKEIYKGIPTTPRGLYEEL
jgi:GTP-dependent phosphoenolpyruvate carboxykinase